MSKDEEDKDEGEDKEDKDEGEDDGGVMMTKTHWGQTPIYPAGTLRVFWEFLDNSLALYLGVMCEYI